MSKHQAHHGIIMVIVPLRYKFRIFLFLFDRRYQNKITLHNNCLSVAENLYSTNDSVATLGVSTTALGGAREPYTGFKETPLLPQQFFFFLFLFNFFDVISQPAPSRRYIRTVPCQHPHIEGSRRLSTVYIQLQLHLKEGWDPQRGRFSASSRQLFYYLQQFAKNH